MISTNELPDDKDDIRKPNSETEDATDPPDKMEGPVSSLMQGIKDKMEEADTEEPPEEKKE